VKKLAVGGMKISPGIRAHLSPLQWEHINFHRTYPFNRPELPGRLRDWVAGGGFSLRSTAACSVQGVPRAAS
jgi:hypothetical protein